MRGRFYTLQSVGAALLLAAYLAGWMEEPLNGPARFACAGLTLVALACLYAIATQRPWGRWWTMRLPFIALAGTILGFIGAVRNAGVDQAAAQAGAGLALYSTLFGIGWCLWLLLTMDVMGQGAEDTE